MEVPSDRPAYHPPTSDDLHVLAYAGLIAWFFAVLRYFTRQRKINWARLAVQSITSGMWGAIAGWLISSLFPDIQPALLGAISATLGWFGYETISEILSDVVIFWLRRKLGTLEEIGKKEKQDEKDS